MGIIVNKFDNFTVYKENSELQFEYIDIDKDTFYLNICRYLLDEQKINKYTSVNVELGKELDADDYMNIFNRLIQFVDYEKIIDISNILDPSVLKFLDNELIIESSNLRKDKWGRIGEYIFNLILDEYFKLDCVVRKFALNTSPNMSVYGIDTIHCSMGEKTIYFGESKFVTDIDQGISLINISLSNYEEQIFKEYYTITNKNFVRNSNFVEKFLNPNFAYTFNEFIAKAGINEIGVPIFIAHAGDKKVDEIFAKLRKIKRENFCGLMTKYYVISFPILNKEEFKTKFVEVANEKLKEIRNAKINN